MAPAPSGQTGSLYKQFIILKNIEPEIILTFVHSNTFLIKIKFDRQISNLNGFFTVILSLRWLNPMKDNSTSKLPNNLPGDYIKHFRNTLDHTLVCK